MSVKTIPSSTGEISNRLEPRWELRVQYVDVMNDALSFSWPRHAFLTAGVPTCRGYDVDIVFFGEALFERYTSTGFGSKLRKSLFDHCYFGQICKFTTFTTNSIYLGKWNSSWADSPAYEIIVYINQICVLVLR